ncbi:MAG: zinc carboxypeptidase [Bdellovibrio sp.]|nr:zinc carboxypeptidase [Bdellovibrio sp.]
MKPNTYSRKKPVFLFGITLMLCVSFSAYAESNTRFIHVEAANKAQRSAIANHGMSIESVRSDSVWGFATLDEIANLQADGFKVLGSFDPSVARGGHESGFGFPPEDSRFHTYQENFDALKELQGKNPDISAIQSIGKSLENRDLWAIHFNTSAEALKSGVSNKPGIIFMGNHHAREHLSLEVPLMLAQYLMEHRKEANIAKLLETRDIWIIPMVNPDGAEFDTSNGHYAMWRKNRRHNQDGSLGVDLNRNYSYKWGTGGSSSSGSSDVFMGPKPFSEPETTAIKDFVDSHLNTKILLTFHTFSELILYPWGHSNDKISNSADLAAFENMAKTMAAWNHYTPEQASDLYIASGDTTDWAYGVHGIFAFTFELSPSSMWEGGFYPGAGVIDRVFNDNLQPCLYLLDLADNPHRAAASTRPSDLMESYVQPQGPNDIFLSNPTLENFGASTDPR